MLRAILFNDPEKFDYTDQNNYIDNITDNCIILCEDSSIKSFLSQQIQDICDGKHLTEGHDYYADDDCQPKITNRFEYLPTAHLTINDTQKVYITIEAPFVLMTKQPEDIWFAIKTKDNKISIYPFRIFKGYKEDWERGVECVYKSVIAGRYGCYNGYGNICE